MKKGLCIASDEGYGDGELLAVPCPGGGGGSKWRDAHNFHTSSARIHIEQAFGQLVWRSGIFWRPLRMPLLKTPLVIKTAFVSNNHCKRTGPVNVGPGGSVRDAITPALRKATPSPSPPPPPARPLSLQSTQAAAACITAAGGQEAITAPLRAALARPPRPRPRPRTGSADVGPGGCVGDAVTPAPRKATSSPSATPLSPRPPSRPTSPAAAACNTAAEGPRSQHRTSPGCCSTSPPPVPATTRWRGRRRARGQGRLTHLRSTAKSHSRPLSPTTSPRSTA